jgi:hypothetical protein
MILWTVYDAINRRAKAIPKYSQRRTKVQEIETDSIIFSHLKVVGKLGEKRIFLKI